MKKVVFITALLAFVAGTSFAVTSFYSGDTNGASIENTNGEKGDKDKKEDKEKASATTTEAKSKDCAEKQACCKKGKKAACSDDKKKEKDQ